MATFFLVHGSWQASWCWRDVARLLQEQGHRVEMLDLPGHGEDAAAADSTTMEHYLTAIARSVAMLGDRVILVGHSMGGVLAVLAAQRCAGAVGGVVHVAANIPADGAPMISLLEHYDPAFPATFLMSPDGRTASLPAEAAIEFLYPCCPTPVVNGILSLLTPEPTEPYSVPVAGIADSRIPQYYIGTLRDRVVRPAIQEAIQRRVLFRRVFSLDTDHSPFFSAPGELVECLVAIGIELA